MTEQTLSTGSNQAPAQSAQTHAARGQDAQAGANERDRILAERPAGQAHAAAQPQAGAPAKDNTGREAQREFEANTGHGKPMPDLTGSFGTTTVPKTSNDGAGGDTSGVPGSGEGNLGGAREQIAMRQDGEFSDPTVGTSSPREVVMSTERDHLEKAQPRERSASDQPRQQERRGGSGGASGNS